MRKSFLFFFGMTISLFPTAGHANSNDPCALVTKAEIKDAVGAEVTGGTVNKNNQAVCDYQIGGAGSILNISLVNKTAADGAERTVEELKKRKIAAVLVKGLGDGAYASSPGYGMQQLAVYKGSKQVLITALIAGVAETKVKEVIKKVMRKALGKVK